MAQSTADAFRFRRIGSGREITAEGEVWRVTELDARETPGASGDRCLLFDSHSIGRRVWSYPDDWRRLPDAELYALRWRK
jgi:hypothetical protein